MLKFMLLVVWTVLIMVLTIAGTACYQDTVKNGKEITYTNIPKCLKTKLSSPDNYVVVSQNLLKNAPYGDRVLRAARAWNGDDNAKKDRTEEAARHNVNK